MGKTKSARQATGSRLVLPDDYVAAPLAEVDPEIREVLGRELERQRDTLEMIASENFVPQAERAFRFDDFARALTFTNRVGEQAEEEGHHPTLLTEWGRVTVTWWTHKIGGLHRNDFVMAARTDETFGG